MFEIDNTKKGYVVRAYGYNIYWLPLRNFGWSEGAARVFRDWCNIHMDEQLAKLYAKTYDEEVLFEYPEIRDGKIRMRLQKTYN